MLFRNWPANINNYSTFPPGWTELFNILREGGRSKSFSPRSGFIDQIFMRNSTGWIQLGHWEFLSEIFSLEKIEVLTSLLYPMKTNKMCLQKVVGKLFVIIKMASLCYLLLLFLATDRFWRCTGVVRLIHSILRTN